MIANVTNEVDPDYDLKFIYDKIKSFPHSEALQRSIKEKDQYLDPTYRVDTDSGEVSILKDLSENLPNTRLPPLDGFL
jgi:hypothetical protein